jgi:hypothetical protein
MVGQVRLALAATVNTVRVEVDVVGETHDAGSCGLEAKAKTKSRRRLRVAEQMKGEQWGREWVAERSRAEQSRAEQSRAEQSRAEQSRAEAEQESGGGRNTNRQWLVADVR